MCEALNKRWDEGYLLPTWARKVTCRHSDWMVQSGHSSLHQPEGRHHLISINYIVHEVRWYSLRALLSSSGIWYETRPTITSHCYWIPANFTNCSDLTVRCLLPSNKTHPRLNGTNWRLVWVSTGPPRKQRGPEGKHVKRAKFSN